MILHMINKRWKIIFLVFWLMSVGGSALGQLPSESTDSGLGGNNVIEGRVQSTEGRQLNRRLRVRLSTQTRGDITSTTDDAGRFVFRGLSGGDYTIVIDGEKDFEPASQQINIIQFRGAPGQNYQVLMRLALKPNGDLKAGVVGVEFANVPKNSLSLYEKGIELSKTKDYRGAIKQFQLAIAEYSQFMMAYNEIGVQYLKINELIKADDSFQAALKINSAAFIPLVNHGITLSRLSKFAESEKILKNALKAEPKSSIAHFYLAQAIANQNRFDESEKEFIASIKLGGDEMKEAHRFLAIIYSNRGDKKRAINELETYLRLMPNTPDAEQIRKVIQQLKGTDNKPKSSS